FIVKSGLHPIMKTDWAFESDAPAQSLAQTRHLFFFRSRHVQAIVPWLGPSSKAGKAELTRLLRFRFGFVQQARGVVGNARWLRNLSGLRTRSPGRRRGG